MRKDDGVPGVVGAVDVADGSPRRVRLEAGGLRDDEADAFGQCLDVRDLRGAAQ